MIKWCIFHVSTREINKKAMFDTKSHCNNMAIRNNEMTGSSQWLLYYILLFILSMLCQRCSNIVTMRVHYHNIASLTNEMSARIDIRMILYLLWYEVPSCLRALVNTLFLYSVYTIKLYTLYINMHKTYMNRK